MSVIVPTRNESGNVAELLRRMEAALTRIAAELIVVDDSDDDTPQRVTELAEQVGIPVRLLHRTRGQRFGGLGGAVLAGLRAASAPWGVVMDGDLQHPPEVLPALVTETRTSGADVVVASRYRGSGDAGGLAGRTRRWVSRVTATVSRAVFPLRLHEATDPLSGFFAVRVGALELDRLRPRGFKILLEMLVRCGPLRAREVSYRFAQRYAGESKASLREGLRLVRQLLGLRLWLLTTEPKTRLSKAFAFGLVGLSGMAVNVGALWLFSDSRALHLHYLVGAVLATQVSSAWNFFWSERSVFPGPKRGRMISRFVQFLALNNATLLLRVPLLALFVSVAQLYYLTGNVLVIAILFAVRFLVADRVIFRRKATVPGGTPIERILPVVPETVPAPSGPWRTHLRYRYDIGGLVRIGSQVQLPELDYFRAQFLGARELDLELRVGDVGSGMRRRIVLTHTGSGELVSYEEQLGRLGSNFRLEIDDRVRLTVSPLLARSPHVVYTNVVEALLRYLLVEKDRVLLHSACVDLGGTGVMLSAKTDTGKTGTILRLLRNHGARFLSDDMTILRADGHAYCYPKPLTISHHTLRAVEPGDLSGSEWRRLRWQSRLHSKEGRGLGMRLSEMNLPIMSMNSVTQIMVPPPKYDVDQLVPCDIVRDAQVEHLFIIERGVPGFERVEPASALDELIENTDDAYGFPPFRYFAPTLVLGGDDYQALRMKERVLLASVVERIQVHRLASDDFRWPHMIPRVLAGEDPLAGEEATTAQMAGGR